MPAGRLARARAICLTLTLGLMVAGASGIGAARPTAASAAVIADSTVTAFGEVDAKAAARATGGRVEVLTQRSETDQVFANADGSLTREQHLEPVRLRRGDLWVPVDSTLVRQADGSWAPKASSVAMSFSGGGTGPAVTVDQSNVRLQVGWPSELPTPTVSGATATYSEVFAGVDLELTAVGASFTQHLVVKTREAGKNPRVRGLVLDMRVRGGSLKNHGGGYGVTNLSGQTVLRGAAPMMWDSRQRSGGVTSKETLVDVVSRVDDGDRQAAMGLALGAASVTRSGKAQVESRAMRACQDFCVRGSHGV